MAEKKRFILHTEALNSHGLWIKTDGIKMERFMANPVMYFNHDMWTLPLGRWEDLKVEGGSISASADIDDSSEYEKRIKGKVDKGYIKAASIGVRILEMSDSPEYLKQGQTRPTITKCELIECSIVDVPANSEALMEVRFYGTNDGNGAPTLLNLNDAAVLNATLPPLLNNKDTKQTQTPKPRNMNKKLALLLAALSMVLPEEEAAQEGVLDKAIEKVEALKLSLATQQVEAAQAKGLTGDKAALLQLALVSPEAFATLVASLKPAAAPATPPTNDEGDEHKPSIVEALLQQAAQAAQGDERRNWTYEDYDRNGEIEALKLKNPAKYNKLVEQYLKS